MMGTMGKIATGDGQNNDFSVKSKEINEQIVDFNAILNVNSIEI